MPFEEDVEPPKPPQGALFSKGTMSGGAVDYLLRTAGIDPEKLRAGPEAAMARSAERGVYSAGRLSRSGNEMIAAGIESAGYPTAGKVYGAASELLNPIPTNRLGLALSPLSISEGKRAIGKTLMSPAAKAAEIAKRSVTVDKPSMLSKVQGALGSASSRVKQDRLASAFEDPTILDPKITPSLRQVGPRFEKFFKDRGIDLNETLRRIMGKPLTAVAEAKEAVKGGTRRRVVEVDFIKLGDKHYVPNEKEVAYVEKAVGRLLDKLHSTGKLADEEAILGERLAGALSRASRGQAGAQKGPSFVHAIDAQKQFTEIIKESGGGMASELKNLKNQWYRALVRDDMEQLIPRNLQGSPNALSTIAMGRQFAKAGENLAEGEVPRALWNSVLGMAFSPSGIGRGIKTASSIKRNKGGLAVIGSNVLGDFDER